MFRSYYGLSFKKEKDHFLSKDISEMTSRLDYLKDTRGIGLFTARPGMGKSFALRCFAKSLNPNLCHMEYICLSTVSVMEFYRQLCSVLGVEPRGGKPGMFRAVQGQERCQTGYISFETLKKQKEAGERQKAEERLQTEEQPQAKERSQAETQPQADAMCGEECPETQQENQTSGFFTLVQNTKSILTVRNARKDFPLSQQDKEKALQAGVFTNRHCLIFLYLWTRAGFSLMPLELPSKQENSVKVSIRDIVIDELMLYNGVTTK